jgi:uncharacterized OB-fold protein
MSAPRPIAPGLFTETADGWRLVAGECRACRRLHFPLAAWCPYCGGADTARRPVGPTGRLFLHTAVQSAPPGYRGPLPYGFGIVELSEGLRVVTRLTEHDPARLSPGLAMRLVVETLAGDGDPVLTYAFAPEPA